MAMARDLPSNDTQMYTSCVEHSEENQNKKWRRIARNLISIFLYCGMRKFWTSCIRIRKLSWRCEGVENTKKKANECKPRDVLDMFHNFFNDFSPPSHSVINFFSLNNFWINILQHLLILNDIIVNVSISFPLIEFFLYLKGDEEAQFAD